MNIDYTSANPVLFQFTRFSGGKFITNCLALSKYCVPQDTTSINYLINYPNDYNFRFQKVLSTLPPNVSEMKKWISKYEFGENQQKPALPRLSKTSLNFFLGSHQPAGNIEDLSLWKNANIVIILTNHRKFSEISCKLKGNGESVEGVCGNYCVEKYDNLKGNDWPTWKEFNKAKFNVNNIPNLSSDISREISNFYINNQLAATTFGFDVDECIFEKSKFLNAISELYNKLEYDDFNPYLVGEFWQRYIRLHID